MRPCTCEQPGCRLCWLYHHDADYRALWSAPTAAITPSARLAPCIHLGVVVDRLGCPCLRKWVRRCAVHGTCTLALCQTCPDYEADEGGYAPQPRVPEYLHPGL